MSEPNHTPLDAASFIAAAERASNTFDLDTIVGVYAEQAILDVIVDGARERHAGRDKLRLVWAGYLDAMRRQRLTLRKELLSFDGRTLTNAWHGRLGRGHEACGTEIWRFDEGGLVVEHHMWSFLDLRGAGSLRGRVRLGLAYPLIAVDLMRAQRAARPGPRP